MSYAELYKYCQELSVPISRRDVVPRVVLLAKRPRKPFILARTMDPAILSGYIWFPPAQGGDPSHPYLRWGKGEPVIAYSRSLNYCWTRFVIIKELMHYFDQPLERVTTSEELGALLSEFSAPQIERSPAMDSEVKALWMALGIMCPESLRQEFESQLAQGQVTEPEIAQRLKMPLSFVPLLFDPQYKRIIAHLCEC